MSQYIFGMDVGGTTIKCGLLTKEGELIQKCEIPTDKSDGSAHILDDIVSAAEKMRTEQGIDKADILGIGVGVPGPVLADGTLVSGTNLGLGRLRVADEITKKSGYRAAAANDANVAALGEQRFGGGMGTQNMIMITLGTGVGGGIIVNGKVVSGADGAGGEIGHIPVNPAEEAVCGCGNRGCLEQYASATGIVRMARKRLKAKPEGTVLSDSERLGAKEVIDAAKKGDPLGIAIVQETGDILGRAMAMLAVTVNPELFVIGGGVSKAGDILLDAVRAGYRKYVFHAAKDTPVVLAKLGNDAGMYGAAALIMGAV